MNSTVKKITRYGAYGVIIQNSRLLLTLKKSGPYKGLWDLPGGGIEFGESPEIALKREILEETTLSGNDLELITALTHHGEYLDDRGELYQFHHIGIIYRVNMVTEIPDRIPEEEKRWGAVDQIVPDELTPFAKSMALFRVES